MQDKNNPTRPAHLPRTERRFVKFGGGLSAEQLSWLRAELGHAREQQQRVLVFCHLALHPATCLGACLLWNYEEVLALVREFTDVCVATFAGHAHQAHLFAFASCLDQEPTVAREDSRRVKKEAEPLAILILNQACMTCI